MVWLCAMPRALRIEYEGAAYHAMARGQRRGPIVQDDSDRRVWIGTLEEAVGRFGLRVLAYVLMGNHYCLQATHSQTSLAPTQLSNVGRISILDPSSRLFVPYNEHREISFITQFPACAAAAPSET